MTLPDGSLEGKRNLRFRLRVELEPGAWVQAETRRDDGPWRRVWTGSDLRRRIVTVPLAPGACERFSIRLTGEGGCTVRGLEREVMTERGR